MSLGQVIWFSMATVLFGIGVHQVIVLSDVHEQSFMNSIMGSYWLFMLSIGCLLAYAYLKNKNKQKKN